MNFNEEMFWIVFQRTQQYFGLFASEYSTLFVLRENKKRRRPGNKTVTIYTNDTIQTYIEGGTVRIGEETQQKNQSTTKDTTKDTNHTLTNMKEGMVMTLHGESWKYLIESGRC